MSQLSEMILSMAMYYQHQLFVYTQLNDQFGS